MTVLEDDLFANIYIIAFWMFYRFCLKNQVYFQTIRIYLISSMIFSLLLPLLQNSISNLLSYESNFVLAARESIPSITYINTSIENFVSAGVGSLNWPGNIEILILSGIIITILIQFFRYLKILSIIRRSKSHTILGNQIQVLRSNEVSVPFIYQNSIVLPDSILSEEESMVISHEALHHKYGHHIDYYLLSVFQALFWVNPFILLLKRALSLNHEYQVDNHLVSMGIDPIVYKLTLVKYSVGSQKFALVNRLSNSNIKSRIIMINKNHNQKGKWRLLVAIPMIALILTVMCLSCARTDSPDNSASSNMVDEKNTDKFLLQENVVEIIEISSSAKELQAGDNFVAIMALMNKKSDILISGDVVLLENVEEKIFGEYARILKENEENHSNGSINIKIISQNDVKTNKSDYQDLIKAIGSSLLRLQNFYSNSKFSSDFNSLSVSDKEIIEELISLKIYQIVPGKNI